MKRISRRVGRVLVSVAVLLFIFGAAYYWLILENHVPTPGGYRIDIDEVRRLADSLPGGKPGEIRFERIALFQFPGAVVSGGSWRMTDIPVFSYQLVYPDRTLLVDTGLDEETARSRGAVSFDPAAYSRMSSALGTAWLVVVTHEHFDHLRGLTRQPDLKALLARTRLTREQLESTGSANVLPWPEGALRGYEPLVYDRLTALAPGVVLIKAAGHSPGSQMLFVQLSDGAEYLLVGDVAWQLRNIELVRERARIVTWWFLHEDRDSVMRELVELNRLRAAEPALHMVPGHDGPLMTELVDQGLLVQGFK
jgi:glyoxylase-like metal-dependent hydrolase (beta-lactamase superfamily II)